MKKILAVFLILCMLLPMIPSAAADNTPAPSIEDILNDYHSKAFEAQTSGDTVGTSTYSRSTGSGKTLEEETVDTLNAAGYEAYNVTAGNYDALEDELNTDFADMGLDPNCSYIVVISGEEENSTNFNSRAIDPPSYEDFGGDGSSTFTYTSGGVTYTMRYATIIATDDSRLYVTSAYTLAQLENLPTLGEEVLAMVLTSLSDSVTTIPVASIATLMGDAAASSNYTLTDTDSLVLHAATAWTRQYIQIWNNDTSSWQPAQCSSRAVTKARCAGYLFNIYSKAPEWFDGEESSATTYSPNYQNVAQRMRDAVGAFLVGKKAYDRTGNITFYLLNKNEIEINGTHEAIFAHYEWTGVALPIL